MHHRRHAATELAHVGSEGLILPLQPAGVGMKSGWTPASNVLVEPTAVPGDESSPLAAPPELVVLVLVSDPPTLVLAALAAPECVPPEKVDEASPLRAHDVITAAQPPSA